MDRSAHHHDAAQCLPRVATDGNLVPRDACCTTWQLRAVLGDARIA